MRRGRPSTARFQYPVQTGPENAILHLLGIAIAAQPALHGHPARGAGLRRNGRPEDSKVTRQSCTLFSYEKCDA